MQILGIADLVFRDKETLEVTRTVPGTNILQNNLIVQNFFGGDAHYTRQKPIGADIVLLSRTLAPTPFMHDTAVLEVLAVGQKIQGVPVRKWVDRTELLPDYVQFKSRFLAPDKDRVIGSVALSSGANTIDTYLKLDAPVTQTPNEVLDVSYRVQWLWSDTGSISYAAAKKFFKYWAGVTEPVGGRALGQIDKGMIPTLCHSIARPGRGYDTLNVTGQARIGNDSPAASNWVVPSLLKVRNNVTLGLSDNIGAIMATACYAYDTNSDTKAAPDAVYTWEPLNTAKVQPVHKHSSGAVLPFLDLNFLAAGTGRIVPEALSWNGAWPELYRVDITTAGNMGVSEYKFSRRPTLGFDGNKYKERIERIPFWTARSAGHIDETVPYTYNTSAHGLIPDYTDAAFCVDDSRTLYTEAIYKSTDVLARNRQKHYNGSTIITYNELGLSKINLMTGEAVHFNASTSPAMPATDIRQVAIGAEGEIYVACANTGLYRIASDNSAVDLRVYDFGGEAPCTNFYAVAIGAKDESGITELFAVSSEGLLISIDNGATWVAYNATSTTTLSYQGISDNNWQTVSGIVVDKATKNVLILRDIATTVRNEIGSVWWNPGTGTVSVGPNITSMRCSDRFVGVSDADSFWVALNLPGEYTKLTFGSSNTSALFAKSVGEFAFLLDAQVAFEKGPDGKYGVVVAEFNEKAAQSSTFRIVKADGTNYGVVPCDLNPASLFNTTNDGRSVYRCVYLRNGMYLMHFDADHCGAPFVTNLATRTVSTTTPLAGEYTWLVWEQYGWGELGEWILGESTGRSTHPESNALINNVSIAFVGDGDDSFLESEYYTFAVCNGIMKDNATTLKFDNNFYALPVVHVPNDAYSVASYTYLGAVTWKPIRNCSVASNVVTLTEQTMAPQSSGAVSPNALVGDWSVQFSNIRGNDVAFGLAKSNSEDLANSNVFTCVSTLANLKFSKTTGAVLEFAATQPRVDADKVVFKKTGINVQMLVNDVVVYSTTVESGNVYYPFVRGHDGALANSVCPSADVLTNGTIGYVTLGNVGEKTGLYDPSFVALEYDMPSAVKILVEGSAATKKIVSDHSTQGLYDLQHVSLDPQNSRVFFSTTAIGQMVAVEFSYIKR